MATPSLFGAPPKMFSIDQLRELHKLLSLYESSICCGSADYSVAKVLQEVGGHIRAFDERAKAYADEQEADPEGDAEHAAEQAAIEAEEYDVHAPADLRGRGFRCHCPRSC